MRAVGLVAGLLAVLAAAPAQASVVVTSGLAPVHAVRPATTTRGTIALLNQGDAPWTGMLYLADYRTEAPDTVAVLDAASTARSCASWLDVDAATVTVAAGASVEVGYAVTPPSDAAVGSHWCLVMIEPVDWDPAGEDGGLTLRSRLRMGVRVTAEIPGGAKSLGFGDIADEPRGLRVDVHNDGTSWQLTSVRVELFSALGERAGVFATEPWSLYPGCSWRYRVQLEGVPAGSYTALVVADGGDDAVIGARHAVELR